MLKKLTRLQNIGLFRNGTPQPVTFDPLTLIYAENGRGKSTIATLLRSCAIGDSTRLGAKRTFDVTEDIEVDLLFVEGQKNVPICFHHGKWDRKMSSIVIFDSEFVEQNVYSGYEVRSDQRQALLEFALGAEAVAPKQGIDDITKQIEIRTRRRSEAEKVLAGLSGKMKTEQFIKLPVVPDAEGQLAALHRRIEAAKNSQALLDRQDPEELQLIEFDIDGFFDFLGKTIEDVHKAAEMVVRQHFAKHSTPIGIEDWVSRGLVYGQSGDCPYCGQTLTGVSLISSYRDYFNQAYTDLKQQVALLGDNVQSALSDDTIQDMTRSVATNSARIDAWKDKINVESPSLDINPLRDLLCEARELALELSELKRKQPLEKIQSDDEQRRLTEALNAINLAISDYNTKLMGTVTEIRT